MSPSFLAWPLIGHYDNNPKANPPRECHPLPMATVVPVADASIVLHDKNQLHQASHGVGVPVAVGVATGTRPTRK